MLTYEDYSRWYAKELRRALLEKTNLRSALLAVLDDLKFGCPDLKATNRRDLDSPEFCHREFQARRL